MKKNIAVLEVRWFLAAFALTIVLLIALTGKGFYFQKTIEIRHYTTYLSLDLKVIVLAVFCILLLLVYLIKEGIQQFSRPFENIILSIILIANGIVLTFLIKLLSLLSVVDLKTGASNKSVSLIIILLFVLQLTLLLGLMVLGIRTGMLLKNSSMPAAEWEKQ